jgi:hypothetical protein
MTGSETNILMIAAKGGFLMLILLVISIAAIAIIPITTKLFNKLKRFADEKKALFTEPITIDKTIIINAI